MPRRDRTFSSADIVRIWINHLTRDERTDVVCFFEKISRRSKGTGSRTVIRQVVGFLVEFLPSKKGGDLAKVIEKSFDLIDDLGDLIACGKRAERVAKDAGFRLNDFDFLR